MRTTRLLSLPAHGAIEFAAGLAMMILPVALSFDPGAMLVCVALGAILAGVSLGLTTRTPGALSAHLSFDTAFLVVTALAALALAAAGQPGAVILLAATVALEAALTFTTRHAITG